LDPEAAKELLLAFSPEISSNKGSPYLDQFAEQLKDIGIPQQPASLNPTQVAVVRKFKEHNYLIALGFDDAFLYFALQSFKSNFEQTSAALQDDEQVEKLRMSQSLDMDAQEAARFEALQEFLISINRRIQIVDGDGNCLFRSIALLLHNDATKHSEIRKLIVQEMKSNQPLYEKQWKLLTAPPERQFCEDNFTKYLEIMARHEKEDDKDPEYASLLEVFCISCKYQRRIIIYNEFNPTEPINQEFPPGSNYSRSWELHYHRGIHYNPVFMVSVPPSTGPEPLHQGVTHDERFSLCSSTPFNQATQPTCMLPQNNPTPAPVPVAGPRPLQNNQIPSPAGTKTPQSGSIHSLQVEFKGKLTSLCLFATNLFIDKKSLPYAAINCFQQKKAEILVVRLYPEQELHFRFLDAPSAILFMNFLEEKGLTQTRAKTSTQILKRITEKSSTSIPVQGTKNLCVEDLYRFDPYQLLNDSNVNWWLQEKILNPNMYCIHNSQQWPWISGDTQNYQRVKRSNNASFFTPMTFFPVHSQLHWLLFVWIPQFEYGFIMDSYLSLGRWTKGAQKDVIGFLNYRAEQAVLQGDKRGLPELGEREAYDFSRSNIFVLKTTPQQKNDFDCGVYLIEFIEILLQKQDFFISRRRTQEEIEVEIEGCLNQTIITKKRQKMRKMAREQFESGLLKRFVFFACFFLPHQLVRRSASI
jgi:hypothetical protein